MKNLLILIIFGILQLNSAQFGDILKSPKILGEVKNSRRKQWKPPEPNFTNKRDIFNVEWRGNGEFGLKFKSNSNNNNIINNINNNNNNDNNDTSNVSNDNANHLKITESELPSQILEPPFPFYSSSIRNFVTEHFITPIITTTTTTAFPIIITSNSPPVPVSSDVKMLRIYEITRETSTDRSFVISDPSKEIQSYDSLRSVFLSGISDTKKRLNPSKKVGISSGFHDKSLNVNPKTDVISTNRLKVNPSRGNRKYQQHESDSDEITARRNSWVADRNRYTDGWTTVRSPINCNNHLRFIDGNTKVGPVPGVPRRDYPIHQEYAHLQLRNPTRRFMCPVDASSHIYLADRASRCQIFYVCFGTNVGIPMVCPNGTLFSQELQVCDWWYNVIC